MWLTKCCQNQWLWVILKVTLEHDPFVKTKTGFGFRFSETPDPLIKLKQVSGYWWNRNGVDPILNLIKLFNLTTEIYLHL